MMQKIDHQGEWFYSRASNAIKGEHVIVNWKDELYNEDEKPLDRLVDGYSHTSVFRTMAFIGDSLSS